MRIGVAILTVCRNGKKIIENNDRGNSYGPLGYLPDAVNIYVAVPVDTL